MQDTTKVRAFPQRYWESFWQQAYFSTTSENIADDVILNYLSKHTKPNRLQPNPWT